MSSAARLLELGGSEAVARQAFAGGSRIGYYEAGEGHPVVLLHGGTGGGANWYRLLGRLSRTLWVLAPDLPGFGRSDPVEPEGSLGVTAATALLRWLDALALERVHLVGTSFGGLAAMRLAQLAPDRVRRLALLEPAGLGRSLPWVVRWAALPVLGPMLCHPSRRSIRWQLRHLMTSDRSRLPPSHEDALVEYAYHSAAACPRGWLARVLRDFGGLAGQRELMTDAELRDIRASTLVVWGARDRFLPPSHGRRAASLIPGASLRLIASAGHSPNWEAPDELLSHLQPFLEAAASPT